MDLKQVNGPLLLSPHVVTKIWGGNNLYRLKSLSSEYETKMVGETWEVSRHPDGPSRYQDKSIESLFSDRDLPYLVKFIDTTDNLSVQVHPGDEYAKKYENSKGKTECWIILDAKEDAGIYLGLKRGVTKNSFRKAIENSEDLSSYMQFYNISPGDFFFVPSGTAHAIGKGVTLAEIQQSSGITYRVWDWNRVDSEGRSRELHVDKAMDVIDFSSEFNDPQNFKVLKDLFNGQGRKSLVNHPEFIADLHCVKNGEVLKLAESPRVQSIVCLKGEVELHSEDGNISLKPFQSGVFLPNQNGKLISLSGEASFVHVY